jgi:hypothetical protein
MAAFTQGKQRVFDILQKYIGNDNVYYETSIGHGYSVIGRRTNKLGRLRIDFLELDYSNNYESDKSKFIHGYTKLMLPDPPKVYRPDPLYY